jgi:sugar lactone lactonase YvrE
MRLWAAAAFGVVVAAWAYLAFWPTWVQPVAWTPGPNPGWTGVFAGDIHDEDLARIETGRGPEDVAIGADGLLYTGLEDGRIVRCRPDGGGLEDVARTDGRPLGLGFDAGGELVVADAKRGLLRVTLAGEVSVLTDRAGDRPIGFADDLDIAPDGTVWFSDMTTRYPDDMHMDFWEGRATGRLLTFDPATGETAVRADSLHYPNGVALGPGARYVLVCEAIAARITRLWIAGPRSGEREVFVSGLPGCADNLSYNGAGLFWVALVGNRNADYERHASRPRFRQALTRIPHAKIPHPLPWIHGAASDWGVIAVDTTGAVRACFHGAAGTYGAATSANQVGSDLFIGSLRMTSVARISLSHMHLATPPAQ